MRASGSSTTFGRSPCAKARAVAQFHSEPRLDSGRAVQSHHIGKPLFEKLTRPPGGALANLSFGPFRLVPPQFLLLEGDNPVPFGSRALEILIALLERRRELFSKKDLMARDSMLTAFALAPASV